MYWPKLVRAIVVVFLVLNISSGISGPVNGYKRSRRVNRILATRPQIPLLSLPLPLFRSVNAGDVKMQSLNLDNLPTSSEERAISPDYAPTAPTTSQQDDGDDAALIPAVTNVRALNSDEQSGRTFKHLLMLRGLLGTGSGYGGGGGGGTGGGGGGGGGYSIPYIIINQPLNFTNQNNNSLINNPPVTTTTGRRRKAPLRYIPIPVSAGGSYNRATEVQRLRQNDQEQPQFSVAIPAPSAAAMLGLDINDLLPMATAWPNIASAPQLRQRNSNRRTPFDTFANNLRGIPFF